MSGPQSVRAAVLHTRSGAAGLATLGVLVALSGLALGLGLPDAIRDWNDPAAWLLLPKSAIPEWANVGPARLAEHMVLDEPHIAGAAPGASPHSTAVHTAEIAEGGIPGGIIYEYGARYSGAPLLWLRAYPPGGGAVDLAYAALPYSEDIREHSGRIFSTDSDVQRLVLMQRGGTGSVEDAVFGGGGEGARAGTYRFAAGLYGAGGEAEITGSVVVVAGGAYGAMGTDEMRRDISSGLLLGTPLALFVGTTVAVASVAFGLAYGMYAGYAGGRRDEAMMRLNDVVYALPALPFLVILAVTISSSIFVTVAFLVLFGWVGVAKVSRSMSLQARSRGYVEAARAMGLGDTGIIARHIMPQLLPYALASIAISVPAAITTEAGLSFLGLGDPEFPTWGSMLQDASRHGAAARGLWWWVLPPGIMIAAAGMAFVLIGGAIDAAVNPRGGAGPPERRGRRPGSGR